VTSGAAVAVVQRKATAIVNVGRIEFMFSVSLKKIIHARYPRHATGINSLKNAQVMNVPASSSVMRPQLAGISRPRKLCIARKESFFEP